MTQKAENEFWLAQRFAEAYNRDHGTDYEANPANAEQDSADAYLLSKKSGERIALQICLATTQDRMREEGIQSQIEQKVSRTLMAKGIEDTHVMVVPGRIPAKEDIQSWHDCLVRLVLDNFEKALPAVEIEKDLENQPCGDLHFASVTIYRGAYEGKWKKWVLINFVIAKDVLHVDTTIQGAIDKKVAKNYSDSKSLWLLLQPGDGAHTIRQVELKDAHIRNVDKFAQVWWVYPKRDEQTEIFRFGQGSSN